MKVLAIAAGSEHCLALTSDGTVLSWGNAPEPPNGLRDVIAIAAGTYVSLALRSDGSVVGWGATEIPADLRDVVAIAAGGGMCFATRRDGSVVGWGKHNAFDPFAPVPWDGRFPPAAVSRSGGFALSINDDGLSATLRRPSGDSVAGTALSISGRAGSRVTLSTAAPSRSPERMLPG